MKKVETFLQFEPFPIPEPINERIDVINQNFSELAKANGMGGLGTSVDSVAGRTGDVTLTVTDVAGAAPLNSPAFTGTLSVNGKEVATKDDVPEVSIPEATETESGLMSAADKAKLNNIGSGGNSPSLSGYVRTSGESVMTGNLNIGGQQIKSLADPTDNMDGANKQFVETTIKTAISGIPEVDVSSFVTNPVKLDIQMGGHSITNLTAKPGDESSAATVGYVGNAIGALIEIGAVAEDPRDTYLSVKDRRVTDVGSPENETDAATKKYVDDKVASAGGSGGTAFDGDMKGQALRNVASPSENTDAATKQYADTTSSAAQTAALSEAKTYTDGEIAKIDTYPKTIAVLEYTAAQTGASPNIVPVGKLTATDFGSVDLTWPAVGARNDFVMTLPVAGTYMAQIIPYSPSETPVYLKDFQGTMDGFMGPKAEEQAVPLGTGFSFVFGTNIPNRLVRLPLATPGTARKPLPNMLVIITMLAKKGA